MEPKDDNNTTREETETKGTKAGEVDDEHNPFAKSQEELIKALKHQNKSLRLEVSEKEKQLKELTEELSKLGPNLSITVHITRLWLGSML